MSEQLPAPEFDAQNYARPNQHWTCGYAAEGKPCRVGPDGRGRCQATFECKPVLEIKPGETKGRWRCTRAESACETGPLPDGTCCRPIPKCSPVPSLRRQRGRISLVVIAATMAWLLIVLGNPVLRNRYFNPGEISRSHSGSAFAARAAANGLNPDCGACHLAGTSGPHGIFRTAFHADPSPFELVKLATATPAEVTAIDDHCEKCHTGHAFHQPMIAPISCNSCHQEHRGGKIADTTDGNCNFCHGEAKIMAAAAKAGEHLPNVAFHLSGLRPQLTFDPPHPVQGFTHVIHHFVEDHPQFRFLADKWRDPDTLKFNHALHLTSSTIPALPNGQKLNCTFCHQPDAAGMFMTPVKFENNCRVCHSLQFDPETPGLQLPHGRSEQITAFLHSLPRQYADFAARRGITEAAAQTQFVQSKLAHLATAFGTGEALSQRVFLSTSTTGPAMQIGTLGGTTRAVYPGCAYCHEVSMAGASQIQVTSPVIYERWQIHAEFNHAKHLGITCEKCHDAIHSKDTTDLLLPGRENCVECHSPRGGVSDTCATCHRYHKPLLAKTH